jgi:hypothetical protein
MLSWWIVFSPTRRFHNKGAMKFHFFYLNGYNVWKAFTMVFSARYGDYFPTMVGGIFTTRCMAGNQELF